jgi:hypothetical protein
MLDTIVAMPDVVVAIVTAKKLTEKGLPNIALNIVFRMRLKMRLKMRL